MKLEYTMLGATILLALVNILWAGNVRTKQYGTDWNMGARDEKMPPLDPPAGRLRRRFRGVLRGPPKPGRAIHQKALPIASPPLLVER